MDTVPSGLPPAHVSGVEQVIRRLKITSCRCQALLTAQTVQVTPLSVAESTYPAILALNPGAGDARLPKCTIEGYADMLRLEALNFWAMKVLRLPSKWGRQHG